MPAPTAEGALQKSLLRASSAPASRPDRRLRGGDLRSDHAARRDPVRGSVDREKIRDNLRRIANAQGAEAIGPGDKGARRLAAAGGSTTRAPGPGEFDKGDAAAPHGIWRFTETAQIVTDRRSARPTEGETTENGGKAPPLNPPRLCGSRDSENRQDAKSPRKRKHPASFGALAVCFASVPLGSVVIFGASADVADQACGRKIRISCSVADQEHAR
jgi:hypothetical protein